MNNNCCSPPEKRWDIYHPLSTVSRGDVEFSEGISLRRSTYISRIYDILKILVLYMILLRDVPPLFLSGMNQLLQTSTCCFLESNCENKGTRVLLCTVLSEFKPHLRSTFAQSLLEVRNICS